MNIIRKNLVRLSLFVSTFFFATLIHAAAFQTAEQSTATMGNANAGTAVTDDASAQFWNPAATAFIDQKTVSLSGIGIFSNIHFQPKQATGIDGSPVIGNTKGPGDNGFVPAVYLILPLNDRFVAGFGVTAPFGLATTYSSESVARFAATDSSLQIIDLNPTIAMKILHNFSFGFGLDILWAKAELNAAADIQGGLRAIGVNPAVINSLFPNTVLVGNKAEDWALGWNAGLFYVMDEANETRFGLSYRSRARHDLKGTSDIKGIPFNTFPIIQGIPTINEFTTQNVATSLELPDSITGSASRWMTQRWQMLLDVSYVDWGILKKVVLNYSNPPPGFPVRSSVTSIFDYHNSWRVAVGSNFKLTPKFMLRAGTAYDQTPVSGVFRDARLPDSDRYWLNVGAKYDVTQQLTLNIAYSHIFFEHAKINQLGTGLEVLRANYLGTADLIGAQVTYHMASA